MKRAELPILKWIIGLCLMAVVSALTIADSFAQSARFTIVDARDGLTPEVVDSYAEALGSKTNTPIVKNRVKVIASGKHGFDAGAVDVPEHVRSVETDVTVLIRQGGALQAPISANELTISKRPPQRIRQVSNIQGH